MRCHSLQPHRRQTREGKTPSPRAKQFRNLSAQQLWRSPMTRTRAAYFSPQLHLKVVVDKCESPHRPSIVNAVFIDTSDRLSRTHYNKHTVVSACICACRNDRACVYAHVDVSIENSANGRRERTFAEQKHTKRILAAFGTRSGVCTLRRAVKTVALHRIPSTGTSASGAPEPCRLMSGIT